MEEGRRKKEEGKRRCRWMEDRGERRKNNFNKKLIEWVKTMQVRLL